MDTTVQSVLLIRHARSLANDDPTLYLRCSDHAIALSRPHDDPEAVIAGGHIARVGLAPSEVCCWTSTYLRCQQTQALVSRAAFGDRTGELRARVSVLLREQDFGDWDGLSETEIQARDPDRFARRRMMTDQLGRFYFRYPNGESRADVVLRMITFLGKLHRSRYPHHLIFLHGITQRAFRMAWFDHPVEWFESEMNPQNASVLHIQRGASGRWQESYLP